MNSKLLVSIVVLILVLLTAFGIAKITGHYIKMPSEKVKIETNYGDIVVELYADKAPITVENFKNYVNENFYGNTIFHRVIDGFMIQGGGIDATTGREKTTKDPIKLESNNGLTNDKYTIAMARTYIPDSATSQFFINTQDNDFLNYGERDEGYAVFGKVIEGFEVVDKISKVKTSAGDKPVKNVIIEKISFA